MATRLKRIITNLAILMITVLIFFTVFEIMFYIMDKNQSTKANECRDTFIRDDTFHHIHTPNVTCIKSNGKEFDVTVSINNKGFYDVDHDFESDKKTVVLLGDSFFEGMYLDQNETLTQSLQKELGDDFRVINLGIASYSAITQYTSYKALGEKYNPDYVILGWVINDPAGDFNLIKEFTENEDGTWIYEARKKPRVAKIRGFVGKLKITRLTYNALQRIKGGTAKLGEGDFNFGPSISGEPCHNIYWYFNELTFEENYRCWENNLKFIKRTNDEVESTFILTSVPFPLQVSEHEWKSGKAAWAFEDDFVINNEKPQEILEQFAKTNNIKYLNLLPAFRDQSSKNNQLFFDFDGHWNVQGVKVAANEIADQIKINENGKK